MKNVRFWASVLSIVFACCWFTGCKDHQWKIFGLSKGKSQEKIVIPPEIAGTVAEFCTLVSGGDAPIGGWGVVVGLGKNGSSEIPQQQKSRLIKYLKGQQGIGNPNREGGGVSVSAFLDDLDTAVVRVDAVIPQGAPKGTRIDVVVSAPPRTQTTSLEGGILWPAELQWERSSTGVRGGYLKPFARAEGAIFVNPFLDRKKTADKAKYREGRILGGARIVEDMPIRLQLRTPDYLTCNVLQHRINERFRTRGKKVAVAKTKYYIDIHIPPEHRKDYQHFLQLVMHLPRRSNPGAFEAHANRISQAMTRADANHDSLALVWEAMGRPVLPIVQKMYSSTTPAVAYYSARSGLRLGDNHLAGPNVIRFATISGGAHQLSAIAELGRHPQLPEAGNALRKLLKDRNELVRIAAYEALVQRNDFSAITRYEVDKGIFEEDVPAFVVDLVESPRDYVIYATWTGAPKIVLFGKNMPLANPIFYNAPNDTVTIFNKAADPKAADPVQRREHVVVYRRLPGSNEISPKYRIDFRVWPLIRTLGSRPRPDPETGKVLGLGLTYGQVVGIVCRLCKQKNILAKFVLQQLPELQRIYRLTPSTGRPDKIEQ